MSLSLCDVACWYGGSAVARVDHRIGFLVAAAVLAAALVGCSPHSSTRASSARGLVNNVQDVAQRVAAEPSDSRLTINPPDGATGVSPTETVTAAVAGGRFTEVALATASGASLAGVVSPDGERWASTTPLEPSTSYVLNATSRSVSGHETKATSRFSTLAPGQQVTGKITPKDNETVPADRPVSVLFDKPIGDRAVVEHALQVSANPPVSGTTEWRSDRELVWRPTPSWPPGGHVMVALSIFGKPLGNGLVGASDLRSVFAASQADGTPPSAPSSSTAPASSTQPKSGAQSVTGSGSLTSGSSAGSTRPSAAKRSSKPAASGNQSSSPGAH